MACFLISNCSSWTFMSSFNLVRWAWFSLSNSSIFLISRSSFSSQPNSTHSSSLSRRRRYTRLGKIKKLKKNLGLYITSSTSNAFCNCCLIIASLSAFSFLSCCCIWLNRRLCTWHSSIRRSSSISISFCMAFHWFWSLIQWSNSALRSLFFLSWSSRSLKKNPR